MTEVIAGCRKHGNRGVGTNKSTLVGAASTTAPTTAAHITRDCIFIPKGVYPAGETWLNFALVLWMPLERTGRLRWGSAVVVAFSKKHPSGMACAVVRNGIWCSRTIFVPEGSGSPPPPCLPCAVRSVVEPYSGLAHVLPGVSVEISLFSPTIPSPSHP